MQIGIENLSDYAVTTTGTQTPDQTKDKKTPELTPEQLKKNVQLELEKYRSPVTAVMVLTASTTYKVPVEYIMAIMKNDSGYGTA
ncbi:MAG: hypothetical protein WCG98_00115 [bacterium]